VVSRSLPVVLAPCWPAPRSYAAFDLAIRDPDGYATYRLDGQERIRGFGGRPLSGGRAPEGVMESLEGERPTKRVMITEIPIIDIVSDHPDRCQAVSSRCQATSSGMVVLVGAWERSW
jgi:uncharacterized protein (DUF1330 family)